MTVRAAHPDDAEAIAACVNWMIRDTLATFTTDLRPPEDVATWIANGPVWVAEIDGAVLGVGRLGQFRSGPGYAHTREHSVVLLPEAQGRGLGRALMQKIEEQARKEACHVLVAAISSANPGAVAFHAALGFCETGRMPEVGCKHGRWLDLILMQKTL